MSRRQRTLKTAVEYEGVGLHSGETVRARVLPAPPGTGIVFVRTDLDVPVELRADARNVGDTTMATSLKNGAYEISTVEHLMSAFAGLGVDNAYVEVSAAELPIMDGSAAPFVFLLQSAGIEEQGDGDRVLWKAVNEISRAIQRVNDPDVLRGCQGFTFGTHGKTGFLGKDSVVRVVVTNDLDDRFFRGAVRVTDEIVMSFFLDLELVEFVEIPDEYGAATARCHHGHIQ